MEELKKVRQSLTVARTKDWNQTFRARQLADYESMAGLFERGQVIQRSLLIGDVALDGVDDDDSVQIVQHSGAPRRGPEACTVQFTVSLDILGQTGFVFRT